MLSGDYIVEWIFGLILILSSLGVILSRKPVHSSLFFLVTLLTLAVLYLQLTAQFIAVMQVLVYAGAILVIFMFVMILFQNAHEQISEIKRKSSLRFLLSTCFVFLLTLFFLGKKLVGLPKANLQTLPENFGYVRPIGEAIFIEFFFPFEAVIFLFLVAIIGALYIGKKAN